MKLTEDEKFLANLAMQWHIADEHATIEESVTVAVAVCQGVKNLRLAEDTPKETEAATAEKQLVMQPIMTPDPTLPGPQAPHINERGEARAYRTVQRNGRTILVHD